MPASEKWEGLWQSVTAAYLAAAGAGYFLVLQFCANAHDRDLEAAMTSIFVFGPLAAVVAFIVGTVRGSRAG